MYFPLYGMDLLGEYLMGILYKLVETLAWDVVMHISFPWTYYKSSLRKESHILIMQRT